MRVGLLGDVNLPLFRKRRGLNIVCFRNQPNSVKGGWSLLLNHAVDVRLDCLSGKTIRVPFAEPVPDQVCQLSLLEADGAVAHAHADGTDE
jgi:hypothetical protein